MPARKNENRRRSYRPRSRRRMHRQLTRWCLVIALASVVALFTHPSFPVTATGATGLAASLWALFAADGLAGLGSSRDRRRRRVKGRGRRR